MSEPRTPSPGHGYSRHVHMCQHLLALLKCLVMSSEPQLSSHMDMIYVAKLTGHGPGGSDNDIDTLQRARPCSIIFHQCLGLRRVHIYLQSRDNDRSIRMLCLSCIYCQPVFLVAACSLLCSPSKSKRQADTHILVMGLTLVSSAAHLQNPPLRSCIYLQVSVSLLDGPHAPANDAG